MRGLFRVLDLGFVFQSKRRNLDASEGMLELNDSSPGSLAEPTILPLVPLVACHALVAPLYTLRVDLVFSSEEARVVIAVQRLLPVRYEGSALQKRMSVVIHTIMPAGGIPYLIDISSRVRSKLAQFVCSLAHV